MKSAEAETSVTKAVEFLSSRVAEEARKDSVPLTDIELKQLSFTEESASAEEIAGARAFDEANDTNEFEARITRLFRSAFNHDVQLGMRATWEKHLAALRNHDVYALVMVDQAGIRRPKHRPGDAGTDNIANGAGTKIAGYIGRTDNSLRCGLLFYFAYRMEPKRTS